MAFNRSEIFTTRGELVFASKSLDGSVTPNDETRLGFTDSGLEMSFGDFTFLDSNEESGRGPGVAFFAGQDIRATTILRQWDNDLLAVRFPDQFAPVGGGIVDGRVQIPGNLTPGDSMLDHADTLLLRPTDVAKDPYILAMKAVLVGAQPFEFGTLRIRRIALEFQLFPDDTLVGQPQELYRTLGIGTANDITHP